MDLAILSCSPNCYSTRRLREAAEQRGHSATVLNTLKFSIDLRAGEPDLYYRQKQVDALSTRFCRGSAPRSPTTALPSCASFEEMDVFCAQYSSQRHHQLHGINCAACRFSVDTCSAFQRTTFVRDKQGRSAGD
jgi:ribosomal protein S6--L-glutamate ligase